jgi:hypothetical protein
MRRTRNVHIEAAKEFRNSQWHSYRGYFFSDRDVVLQAFYGMDHSGT